MPLPKPVQGLVIRYAYLWQEEHRRGMVEGVKDPPCAIVAAATRVGDDLIVTVLPITHVRPADPASAVEIPLATKQRLGLDEDRSWVMLTEANRFAWPGPDLRPLAGQDAASVAYGLLPYTFSEEVRLRFIASIRARRAALVERAE